MVLITLPVADLARARAFFEEVGFAFDESLSFDGELTMLVEQATYVVLMAPAYFAERVEGPVGDPMAATSALTTISLPTRAEVDAAVARALAAGARAWKPTVEIAPIYGKSFQDPDGHVWELIHVDETWSGDAA